jgi:hypothetical protein
MSEVVLILKVSKQIKYSMGHINLTEYVLIGTYKNFQETSYGVCYALYNVSKTH